MENLENVQIPGNEREGDAQVIASQAENNGINEVLLEQSYMRQASSGDMHNH